MTELESKLADVLRVYRSPDGGVIRVTENEPMARHTTFRIGGPADLFLEPTDAQAFIFAVRETKRAGVPMFVIGRGSNLLFDDAGFRGAVITTTGMRQIRVTGTEIEADAGASLPAVAKAALDASLSGLEFASGIPGSCGGAVFMNAGAYGGEIAGILLSSTYYDTETGEIRTIPCAEHGFGYRESVYRAHPSWIVLSARFGLAADDPAAIRALTDELMRRRAEKQPLEYPSAGSAFKRCPGRYTAQMIDEAGLKGFTIGGAQISEKHAGFLINRGGATSADVRALLAYVQTELRARFGVEIEQEIVYVPSETEQNV